MTREIRLTNGLVALVDDADYGRLAGFRWHPVTGRRGAIYAHRTEIVRREDGSRAQRSRQMQRDVLDPDWTAPRSLLADHINGDTLDCRRQNLRWASFEVSNRNRRLFLSNTSGYRGVARCASGRFRAVLRFQGERILSAHYATPEEAALAYNRLASLHYGDNAQLNVVPDGVEERPIGRGGIRGPLDTPRIKWSPDLVAHLRALCTQVPALTFPEIAAQMGFSYPSIISKARSLGIVLPDARRRHV